MVQVITHINTIKCMYVCTVSDCGYKLLKLETELSVCMRAQ